MDLYKIVIPQSVWYRIDGYITYIEEQYGFMETALSVYEKIEQAIYSLGDNPSRGSIRKTGKLNMQ